MEVKILYWHWLVLGMTLMIAELFIPSFTIFWFGLGALLVGGLLFFFSDMIFAWQVFIFALASCGFTLLWFVFLKPFMTDRTKAGISREAALGQSGLVISSPGGKKRGVVRFTTPLLGSDEWPFICEETAMPGDRVFVREISGNTLIVAKAHQDKP
jgi:membrane protein implicated in regulation of membrane protease activity